MAKKQASIEQIEATNKAFDLRQQATNDNELADWLGMSKVTLYTRLRTKNWKKPEIALINHLSASE